MQRHEHWPRPTPERVPSPAACTRLAGEVRREVAELQVRMSEATLRSDALRQAGHPAAAAAVVAEQRELLAGFRDRVDAAVSAAAVEREAEYVLAATLTRYAGPDGASARRLPAPLTVALAAAAAFALSFVAVDGPDTAPLRSGAPSAPAPPAAGWLHPIEGHVAADEGLTARAAPDTAADEAADTIPTAAGDRRDAPTVPPDADEEASPFTDRLVRFMQRELEREGDHVAGVAASLRGAAADRDEQVREATGAATEGAATEAIGSEEREDAAAGPEHDSPISEPDPARDAPPPPGSDPATAPDPGSLGDGTAGQLPEAG